MIINLFDTLLGIDPFFIILLILAWGIILIKWRGISFIEISLGFLTFQAIGVMSLSQKSNDQATSYLFGIGIIVFVLGVVLYETLAKPKYFLNNRNNPVKIPQKTEHFYIFLIILLISMYHFYAGGITLLSSDIDVERFDTTRSGLFGIPTRVVQYTFPIFIIWTTLCYFQVRKKVFYYQQIFRISWLALSIFWIFLGFKGSLLNIIILWAIIEFYDGQRQWKLSLKKYSKLSIGVFVGLTMAILITAQYQTVKQTASYFIERITEVAGKPFIFTVNTYTQETGTGFQHIANDLLYVGSVFGITKEPYFTTTKLISAMMWNRSLDSFNPPITITAFGQLYLVGGISGIIIGGLLLGLLSGLLRNKFYYVQSLQKKTLLITFQWLIFQFITKGNLFYLILNIAVGWILFLIIKYLAKYVLAPISKIHYKKTVSLYQ